MSVYNFSSLLILQDLHENFTNTSNEQKRRNGSPAAMASTVRNRLRKWRKRMKRSWIGDVTRGLPDLGRSSAVWVVLKWLTNRFIVIRWTPKRLATSPWERPASSIPMASSLLTLSRRGIPATFNIFNVWCFSRHWQCVDYMHIEKKTEFRFYCAMKITKNLFLDKLVYHALV